jgi:hypothetical protein
MLSVGPASRAIRGRIKPTGWGMTTSLPLGCYLASMALPFAAHCGPSELERCYSAEGTTRKSSTDCLTFWQMPHRCWGFTASPACQ